ncbi:MAG: NUDIX domain-containing protein [Chloroflexi bacterium]|nr:MAG: NUDIX domain-containing protein [Chloroflexota bacterium]
MKPHVEHIHIASIAGQRMTSLREVQATRGRGLVGDRYAKGMGFWRDARVSRDITLIEGEVVETVSEALGPLEQGITRRNLTTRGVRLDGLVGRTFWIGDVLAKGTLACFPCQHLVEVAGRALLRPLARRGGLRADLLSSGQIRTGDTISVVAEQAGVGVVVIREDKVLIGQRISAHGFGTWSTPGGKPGAGESLYDCAIRELREETGLRGTSPRIIAETIDGFPQSRAVFATTFVQVDADGGVPCALEPHKTAAWLWGRVDELPTPLFAPVASLVASGGLQSLVAQPD